MSAKEFPFAGEPQDFKIESSSHQSGVNVVDNQSVRIPPSGEIFSHKPHASDMILRAPHHVTIKSNGRGPRGPEYAERVGETMRGVVSRRIAREARKAFGFTPEEQAENFAQQFIESGESYDYMAQDLKKKRGIRLGEIALKRLARKFEKRRDGKWVVESKAGRHPLEIDEDEVERLCLMEDWGGPRLAKHFHCSETKISNILTSRGIFRQGSRRQKSAEPI